VDKTSSLSVEYFYSRLDCSVLWVCAEMFDRNRKV